MRNLLNRTGSRVGLAVRWVLDVALGFILIVAGIVMLFTPGPGIAAIILGIYLWSREFAWARRILDRAVAWADRERHKLPAFVGRLIDQRNRRHQVQSAADELVEDRGLAEDREDAPDGTTVDVTDEALSRDEVTGEAA